ncbi:hypothetical protein EDB89DRAFT_1910343 [Lactarius sanguifluus]|nr:hypothetical protein EDB89DRAFT_1910343 [Lactarius sanguifluus]
MYAFSRDSAFPASSFHHKYGSPAHSVPSSPCPISAARSPFPTATSIATIRLDISYGIPIVLRVADRFVLTTLQVWRHDTTTATWRHGTAIPTRPWDATTLTWCRDATTPAQCRDATTPTRCRDAMTPTRCRDTMTPTRRRSNTAPFDTNIALSRYDSAMVPQYHDTDVALWHNDGWI